MFFDAIFYVPACIAGGIPACLAAGGGGSAPWGSAPGGDACSGGVPAPGGGCLPLKADGYCCGRFASYWNAFLFAFASTFVPLGIGPKDGFFKLTESRQLQYNKKI